MPDVGFGALFGGINRHSICPNTTNVEISSDSTFYAQLSVCDDEDDEIVHDVYAGGAACDSSQKVKTVAYFRQISTIFDPYLYLDNGELQLIDSINAVTIDTSVK